MNNKDKYNINKVKDMLLQDNIILIDTVYKGVKESLLCLDSEGYYIYIKLNNYLTRHGIGRRFDKSNSYTIFNINHFLELHHIHFNCISDNYINATSLLQFKCRLCGEIVNLSWANVNRMDKSNRKHICCPNCDGSNESIHALVLKQIFLHNYPSTIVEEKSYRNPNTNKICPTDIVNHDLKIAIEIQSQWHDFENIKIKDKLKKQYWIGQGYKFYNPDIRDYSVLEMIQLFFPNIDKIPDYIDFNYNNKINIKIIQEMLNSNMTVISIAEQLNIDKHRIYDAIHNKKLFYPSNYKYKNLIKSEYML